MAGRTVWAGGNQPSVLVIDRFTSIRFGRSAAIHVRAVAGGSGRF